MLTLIRAVRWDRYRVEASADGMFQFYGRNLTLAMLLGTARGSGHRVTLETRDGEVPAFVDGKLNRLAWQMVLTGTGPEELEAARILADAEGR